ncbi:hypothetical protein Tco_1516159 [Tanacetum coccineum]
MERAATIASSLEAEQDSEDQTRFEAASKQSNDPPLSRVNTLGSGEDSVKLKELMELFNAVRLNLLLPVLVYAARHSLTVVRHKLMLPGITSYCWKPEEDEESNRFEEIIDFLNASSVQYALTVNPTIYTTCIEQFWTSAKVKTVNGERQIQALVDKKKVIISKTSIRSDLKLDDAEGTNFLRTATIFTELERMGAKTTSWNEFSSTMASAIILEGMSKHKGVYVTPSHTKKVFANMKRPCKGFSGRVTPLFSTMMVQATEDMGADSATPTDSHSTPIITQPSSLKPQKKKSRRKQRKDSAPTEPTTEETTHEEHVSTPSYDPPPSGEDRMQLAELMKVTLVTKTQERNDEEMLFDVHDDLQGEEVVAKEVIAEKEVSTADLVTIAGEGVTTANVEVTTASAPTTIIDELTLDQPLIEIKAAKPKAVTNTATTITSASTRPKAKGIVFHDQEEQTPASTKTFSSS